MAAARLLGAEHIAVRCRSGTGAEVESTLDRVVVDEVAGGVPVRDVRSQRIWQFPSGPRTRLGEFSGGVAVVDRCVLRLGEFVPGVLASLSGSVMVRTASECWSAPRLRKRNLRRESGRHCLIAPVEPQVNGTDR
jgi:hypothetical protein